MKYIVLVSRLLLGLVFVVFNMSPQERAKFGPLPWVLKNAVFPFLASKHGKVKLIFNKRHFLCVCCCCC